MVRVYVSTAGGHTDCLRIDGDEGRQAVKAAILEACRDALAKAQGGSCPGVWVTFHHDASCEHDE